MRFPLGSLTGEEKSVTKLLCARLVNGRFLRKITEKFLNPNPITPPSTIRLLPAPPAPDSSLIKLSGACPTLSLADRLMLFSPFPAACNWATFPPYLFGFSSLLAAWLNYCIHLARKSQ